MRLLPLVLVAAFVAPAAPAAAAERTPCDEAQVALESFLYGLPRACKRDSDCGGYYYREDVSPLAIVLAKPGVPPELEAKLSALQEAQRSACAARIARGKPEPRPFKTRCYASLCEDAKSVWRRTPSLWERVFATGYFFVFVLAFSVFGLIFGRYRAYWEGEGAGDAYPTAVRLSRWLGLLAATIFFCLLLTMTNLESPSGFFMLAGAVFWAPILGLVACGFVRPWLYLGARLLNRRP